MHAQPQAVRALWTIALIAVCAVAGCTADKSAAGAPCRASSECGTGLCYVNVCLVPGRDEDGDGLDNATEHALGSNPLAADTDNDGKPDGAEVGPDLAHPLNGDDDALADVLESAVADVDRDCLADEVDAHNTVPETDTHVLAAIGCGHVGVCAAAGADVVAVCTNDVLSCDYHNVPGFAVSETCDGKDNDCDGEVDEGFAYAGGGIGERCSGTGACGMGVVECHGAQADCSSNPGASHDQSKPELCNGIDDNCDGQIDEGFAFNGWAIGSPCLGDGECGLGIVECSGNGAPRCSSNPGGSSAHVAPEVCNALDDDCDGVTDNGLAWNGIALGGACQSTGICGGGTVVCGADAKAVCSSAPGNADSKAQAEVCNGLDDNCNGATDEGFDFAGIALGGTCPATGVCSAGTVVCGASGTATCSSHASQASTEVCNGLDDDCDGETDEQLSWLGNPLGAACDGTGACGVGVVQCGSAGQVTCSTNPDGSSPQTHAEICNGLDDDCDGQVDNDIAVTPPLPCPTTGVCAGGAPLLVCAGGGWQCTFTNPAFQITETTCDGLDNDCDGLTDEGLPLAWLEPTETWVTRPVARTELAMATDAEALYVAGGVVDSLIPGTGTVSSGDVWRLQLATRTWSLLAHAPQLARRAAGAVILPANANAGPRLLLLGGQDAAGVASPPAQLDLTTGAVTVPPWKTQPQPRLSPTVVRLGPAQQVWLFGGVASGTAAVVQRLDEQTGTWQAETLPQPAPAVGPVAACANAAGDLYSYGQTLLGEAFFAVLPAGAAAWQALPDVPGKTGQPGRLLCDVSADEVWLVGGVSQGNAPQPVRKFTVSSQTWTTVAPPGVQPGPDGDSWPGPVAPAVAAFGGKLIVALGQTPDGHGLAASWIGLPGAWTSADLAPEPVVGARLFPLAAGVVRVGGASLRVGAAVFEGTAWRNQDGKWTAWPLPYGAGRAFATVIGDPDGQGLLQWGGLTAAPTTGDWQGALETQLPAPGAEHLDLTTGTWQVATPQQQMALPPLRPDAAVAAGALPGQWFVLGNQPATDVPQLWLIDLAKPSKTLVWQGPDPALGPVPGQPQWHAGSALTWDPTWGRVVYACAGTPSSLWHYDFGPSEGWTQSAANLGLTGRLQLLGTASETGRLVIATSLQAPLGVRHVTLGVDVAVTAQPVPAAAIFGFAPALTGPQDTLAWLAEPTDTAGVLRSVWLKWRHACQP